MKLFHWLNSWLPKREKSTDVLLSQEITQRIVVKAEKLQESFRAYQCTRDPLSALMADLYNQDQVARVWKNGAGH